MANKSKNKNYLFSLFEEKLNDTNYRDWYQNLRTFLKTEKKEYILEKPLPDVPKDNAPQEVHTAFNRHKDDSLEVTCLMLITMNYEFQKRFEYVEAYDIIKQLKCFFEKKTTMESNKTSNTILELKENNFEKNASQESFKSSNVILQLKEKSFGNKTRMNTTLELKKKCFKKIRQGPKPKCINRNKKRVDAFKNNIKLNVLTNQRCLYCEELGHWKRNCPKYLETVKKCTKSGISTSGNVCKF